MPKHLYTLLLLLSPALAVAQGGSTLETILSNRGPMQPVIAKIVSWYAPGNGRSLPGSRIVGSYTSTKLDDGSRWMEDSVFYLYDKSRGGDLTTQRIDFTVRRRFEHFGQTHEEQMTQRFDNSDRLLGSSTKGRWDNENTYTDKSRTTYYYNGAGAASIRLDEVWEFATGWQGQTLTSLAYNAAGLLIDSVDQFWNPNTSRYDSGYRTTKRYDVAGTLIEVLGKQRAGGGPAGYTWDTATFISYEYNAAGDQTAYQIDGAPGLAPRVVIRYRYSYDPVKRTIRQIREQAFASSNFLSFVVKDSLVVTPHAGDARIPVITAYRMDSLNGWQTDSRYSTLLDANGNPTYGMYEYYYNGEWHDYWRDRFEYNSYNQLTHYWIEQWDGASWEEAPQTQDERYYYQPYQPLGAPDEVQAQPSITLYPSPATDKLNIALTTAVPQQLQLRLTDLSGRTLRVWTELAPAGRSVSVLDIRSLANGTYIISSSASGNNGKRFTVVR